MLVSALPVAAQDAPASVADRIWVGGPVLTMEDSAPVAEAIAVKDGLILAVGSEDEILGLGGEGTTVTDLHGRALLPGFVDSHGHVMMGGLQALAANLLAPPDGAVTDIASLQQELRQWAADNAAAVEEADLIVGFGYDNSQLAELRHPTRADLDAVSADRPIIIVHQSGHIAAVNSLALERAGMTADTPEPSGGVIRREADGTTPNGVLEEMAFFGALPRVFATLGPESLSVFARAGAEMWARYGYTTGQEGRATPGTVQVFRQVAEAGSLPIDVVAYVDVLTDRDFIKDSASRDYADHFRVGGAKLTIDGSPQGFTAWRDRPYYDPVGDYPPGYSGYPALTDPEILESVDWAFANDVQILTHANGERATDMLVAAVNAAEDKYGPGDRRPVLVHGQFMRPDQVESLDRLDIFPSLFPMHTFYWGDWHRDHTVGPVNGDNISPTGWVRARGMAFGTHHDAPVALPDSMRVLDATVTRRSRSGDIIGPDQRVDVTTALKAMTIWPAWQHFEEDRKGSLVPGKRADLVILSGDPTAIDPEMLDTLEVVETIKDGETIYRADP
ncbi:MAG: amidohydrolase [Rhodobacteraceae bacterium]|nr:amidohydrolase [Paracoccaceae bacterium]